MCNIDHDNQLISEWKRHDWRESIFAPQTAILQALTKTGSTASGLGDCREDALARCLSETAEISALAALRQSKAKNSEGNLEYVNRNGIAAHIDAERAQLNAIFEAHERIAISNWWLGFNEAKRIPEHWLQQQGYADWLTSKRASASLRRVTGIWSVEYSNDIWVMICHSTYENGQDPILGFGASSCPFNAVEKALRENLLMEINLMEVLAARSGFSKQDQSRVEAKIVSYAARCHAILSANIIVLPNQRTDNVAAADLVSAYTAGAVLTDITPAGISRQVWRCRQSDQNAMGLSGPASPFM